MKVNKGYEEYNITTNMYDKIQGNPKNSFFKIGYAKEGSFKEVARWRNSYNMQSYANYGLLQIWCDDIVFSCFENQGGCNTCGGYNKPEANLFACIDSFNQYLIELNINQKVDISRHSIDSHINNLRDVLEIIMNRELFLIECNG